MPYRGIRRHMLPVIPIPPRTAEGWMACLADTYYALKETAFRMWKNGRDSGVQVVVMDADALFVYVYSSVAVVQYAIPVGKDFVGEGCSAGENVV